jgi:hypothetical protein
MVKGDRGWYVYGLQCGLVVLGHAFVRDGVFGDVTEHVVREFQQDRGLFIDGEAGGHTQGEILRLIRSQIESTLPHLPRGYLRGSNDLESGNKISVVNWAVAGGVDCGAVQRRVYGPPFSLDALRNAFDPHMAELYAGQVFIGRRNNFLKFAWSKDDDERAGRCAILAHNWPAGAEDQARNGHVSSPSSKCTWLPRNSDGTSRMHFPDGTKVETRQDWANFYAMGGPHGESRIAKFVTDWR